MRPVALAEIRRSQLGENFRSRFAGTAVPWCPVTAVTGLPTTSIRVCTPVSGLEPRTHHQPGKLQKLSKNDSGFTLLLMGVKVFRETLSPLFSIECSSSTGRCQKTVQLIPGIRFTSATNGTVLTPTCDFLRDAETRMNTAFQRYVDYNPSTFAHSVRVTHSSPLFPSTSCEKVSENRIWSGFAKFTKSKYP